VYAIFWQAQSGLFEKKPEPDSAAVEVIPGTGH
jgi:hypothetical protein